MDDPDQDGRRREALEELARKQREELKEFEERQRRELEEFEKRERAELEMFEHRQNHEATIKIDRTEYVVHERHLTGQQLRDLPTPSIGPDRDLFEVIPGGSDKKVENKEVVKIENGMRFFTAPAQINPGHE